MEIRPVAADELEQFLDILCAAFYLNKDAAKPLFYADPFFDLSLKRVCVDVSPTGLAKILSCLTIVPLQMRIGRAVVPVAGIAAVATPPALRRQGYAGQLLAATVNTIHSQLQFPLTALFPAMPSYYEQFGWSYCTKLTRFTTSPERLPTAAKPARLRPADPSKEYDLAGIRSVYDRQSANRTGACVRGSGRWQIALTMMTGRETLVYEEGRITGYLQCERTIDGRLVVHEMVADTDAAVVGLLAHLSWQPPGTAIEWLTCSADLHRFGVDREEFGLRTEEPDAMLRITDLHAALSHVFETNYSDVFLQYNSELTIMATDQLNSTNGAPITISKAGVRSGGAPSRHWLSADITVLTQLFVGARRPSDVCAMGSLTASDAEALAAADRIFPSSDPNIGSIDHF